MRRLLCSIALLAVLGGAAPATIVISDDPGGSLDDYQHRFRSIARSGEPVVIDGPCYSACTLVLSLPKRQVCATPRGALGVHLGWIADRHGRPIRNIPERETERDLRYPPYLRRWIAAHGGLRPEPKMVAGRDLAPLVRGC